MANNDFGDIKHKWVLMLADGRWFTFSARYGDPLDNVVLDNGELFSKYKRWQGRVLREDWFDEWYRSRGAGSDCGGVIVLALVINKGVAAVFGYVVAILFVLALCALFIAICFGSVWLAVIATKALVGVFA